MPIQTNLDQIPVRSLQFRLPSLGLPYRARFPEISDVIEIRPYTLEAEAVLVGNKTGHEKMAHITSKVVTLPKGLSVSDLLVSDQFVILAIARALTYGETYKFHSTCPNCKHREESTCRVPEELPVRVWNEKMTLPVEITLPCKDRIGIKFLTVREDGELDRYEKQLQAVTKGTTEDATTLTYLRRLAYHVAHVNGGVPDSVEEAQSYIIRLYGEDMAAFKKVIEDNTCGIQYDWSICCDNCQHVYTTSFPITGDFFRGNRQ